MPHNPVTAAREYAEMGWHVFPVHSASSIGCSCARGAACDKAGKHPRTRNGYKDATLDLQQIETWWKEWPDANIGVRTGIESGIVVLDVDPRNGGDASLRELERELGPLPETVTARTGSGGRHIYFLTSDQLKGRAHALGPGLDIKGEGGYVVAAPSRHASGGLYEWERAPGKAPLAFLPPALLARLQPQSKAVAPVAGATIAASGTLGEAAAALARAVDAVAEAPQGQRNETLNRAAWSLGRRVAAGELDESAVERALVEAALRAGLNAPEAVGTTRSGMRAGLQQPIASAPVAYPCTDAGNAERLAARHGEVVRYDHARRRWLCFDGSCWLPDDSGEVERRAKETARSILLEAERCNDLRLHDKVLKWARASESASGIQNMLRLAQAELPISATMFDLDPMLLNVANGTLDLLTGGLRPHSAADMLSKLTRVVYDESADCPRFRQFLSEIFGDAELIAYVQRCAGYCLTGTTGEHALFIGWGTGANGKSTFTEVLRSLLGAYAQQLPPDTLVAARRSSGGPSSELARLHGIRFASAPELQQGARLDEALVKRLTGGDTIAARFLYGEYFEFIPTAKFMIATNHRPVIRGADAAIWRRVHLIPFTVTIPPEQRDSELPTKLQGELSGILNWALEGCREWQRAGLKPPAAVLGAVNEYRDEMDVLGSFIAGYWGIDPSGFVTTADVYTLYKSWCDENGENRLSQNVLGSRLKDRGIIQKRQGQERGWGLRPCLP